jgi:hypothetical protein
MALLSRSRFHGRQVAFPRRLLASRRLSSTPPTTTTVVLQFLLLTLLALLPSVGSANAATGVALSPGMVWLPSELPPVGESCAGVPASYFDGSPNSGFSQAYAEVLDPAQNYTNKLLLAIGYGEPCINFPLQTDAACSWLKPVVFLSRDNGASWNCTSVGEPVGRFHAAYPIYSSALGPNPQGVSPPCTFSCVAGGQNSTGPAYEALSSVVCTRDGLTWTEAPPLPTPVVGAAAFQFNGSIAIVGGIRGDNATASFHASVDDATCTITGWEERAGGSAFSRRVLFWHAHFPALAAGWGGKGEAGIAENEVLFVGGGVTVPGDVTAQTYRAVTYASVGHSREFSFSIDGGGTWRQSSSLGPSSSLFMVPRALAVRGNLTGSFLGNIDTAAGRVLLMYSGTTGYVSEDDGQTWSLIGVNLLFQGLRTPFATNLYAPAQPFFATTVPNGDAMFVSIELNTAFLWLGHTQQCKTCGNGTWKRSQCHFFPSDTDCQPCQTCDPTYQFLSNQCSAMADTVCTTCTACEANGNVTILPCQTTADAVCAMPSFPRRQQPAGTSLLSGETVATAVISAAALSLLAASAACSLAWRHLSKPRASPSSSSSTSSSAAAPSGSAAAAARTADLIRAASGGSAYFFSLACVLAFGLLDALQIASSEATLVNRGLGVLGVFLLGVGLWSNWSRVLLASSSSSSTSASASSASSSASHVVAPASHRAFAAAHHISAVWTKEAWEGGEVEIGNWASRKDRGALPGSAMVANMGRLSPWSVEGAAAVARAGDPWRFIAAAWAAVRSGGLGCSRRAGGGAAALAVARNNTNNNSRPARCCPGGPTVRAIPMSALVVDGSHLALSLVALAVVSTQSSAGRSSIFTAASTALVCALVSIMSAVWASREQRAARASASVSSAGRHGWTGAVDAEVAGNGNGSGKVGDGDDGLARKPTAQLPLFDAAASGTERNVLPAGVVGEALAHARSPLAYSASLRGLALSASPPQMPPVSSSPPAGEEEEDGDGGSRSRYSTSPEDLAEEGGFLTTRSPLHAARGPDALHGRGQPSGSGSGAGAGAGAGAAVSPARRAEALRQAQLPHLASPPAVGAGVSGLPEPVSISRLLSRSLLAARAARLESGSTTTPSQSGRPAISSQLQGQGNMHVLTVVARGGPVSAFDAVSEPGSLATATASGGRAGFAGTVGARHAEAPAPSHSGRDRRQGGLAEDDSEEPEAWSSDQGTDPDYGAASDAGAGAGFVAGGRGGEG